MQVGFWNVGDYDYITASDYSCNPLFAYSDIGGTRFGVHEDSHCERGFHLATIVANLSPNYKLDPRMGAPCHDIVDDVVAMTNAITMQFQASCSAFTRLVNSDPRRLRLRFFAGDAIAFCMGLRQLREPGYIANCYTRPGSTKPLVLDGEDHSPHGGDRTPTKFNVIETGYLIDRIGLLNLLPNVIDALEGPASVLYTSTRVQKASDETNLMESLVCADVPIICALLGVVPSAYLSGHSCHAFEEYLDLQPVDDRSLTNRIVWVPTTSTDPKVDLSITKIRCDLEELVGFCAKLYNKMFSYETESKSPTNRWYQYTRRSFAGLLEFLKRRIVLN